MLGFSEFNDLKHFGMIVELRISRLCFRPVCATVFSFCVSIIMSEECVASTFEVRKTHESFKFGIQLVLHESKLFLACGLHFIEHSSHLWYGYRNLQHMSDLTRVIAKKNAVPFALNTPIRDVSDTSSFTLHFKFSYILFETVDSNRTQNYRLLPITCLTSLVLRCYYRNVRTLPIP